MSEQIIESRFSVQTLNLNAPSGSLAVSPDKLVLRLDDAGKMQECHFLFDVSYETWQRIDAEELFNMPPQRRGKSDLAQFYPYLSVAIEARMSFDMLDDFRQMCENPNNPAEFMAKFRLEGIALFLETEDWFALHVYQRIGSDTPGFYTEWAGLQYVPNENARPYSVVSETARRYFAEREWNVQEGNGGALLAFDYTGESGQWQCYAQIDDEDNFFTFYSEAPFIASSERRVAVAEYITRANYGLQVGNFELDYDTGVIRYKTGLDTHGISFDRALVAGLVEPNLTLLDYHLPGLQAVIAGAEPLETIQKFSEDS
jgi:hypothetical protein